MASQLMGGGMGMGPIGGRMDRMTIQPRPMGGVNVLSNRQTDSTHQGQAPSRNEAPQTATDPRADQTNQADRQTQPTCKRRQPPTEREKDILKQALGPKPSSKQLRRQLTSATEDFFVPLTPLTPPLECFSDMVQRLRTPLQNNSRPVYLVPVECTWPQQLHQLVSVAARFCACFLGCHVVVADPLKANETRYMRSREHPGGWKQVSTEDIVNCLLRKKQADALWTMALSSEDVFSAGGAAKGGLYPKTQLGVISLAQALTPSDALPPCLPVLDDWDGKKRPPDTTAQLLLLLCRQLTRQIGCHVLGLGTCGYYQCLLNADGVSDGIDGQLGPLHLCPICLRKLVWRCSIKDPIKRYEALRSLFESLCSPGVDLWKQEAAWMEDRLCVLTAGV